MKPEAAPPAAFQELMTSLLFIFANNSASLVVDIENTFWPFFSLLSSPLWARKTSRRDVMSLPAKVLLH
jgi:hypothetical protein